jgi:hypothetical protein
LEQIRKIERSLIRARSVPEGERFLNGTPPFCILQVTLHKPCGLLTGLKSTLSRPPFSLVAAEGIATQNPAAGKQMLSPRNKA